MDDRGRGLREMEVLVRREGTRMVLELLDEWPADFVEILGAWPEPIRRPRQRALSKLRNPFR